jgi:hypothetical protein
MTVASAQEAATNFDFCDSALQPSRYFQRKQLDDLFRGFFEEARTSILGQETDVVPRMAAAAGRSSFLCTTANERLRRW